MKEIGYREEKGVAERYRREYLTGIEKMIAGRLADAAAEREAFVRDIFENPESFRRKLRDMLGWPLSEPQESRSLVTEQTKAEQTKTGQTRAELPSAATPQKKTVPAEVEFLSEEDGFSIFRVSLEVMDGLRLSGLLFKIDEEKRPLVIVQHGKLGTPELISGFFGSTFNYHHVVARILQYNVNVFAPQLLLWDSEAYGVPFDRAGLDDQLKSVGSSIAALEVFGLTRVLDYFEGQEYVTNFGMIGLSYGGFYTLYTAALDTRIKSAISCSFFNERSRYSWSDWVWRDSAKKFQDAEIACLVYPRRLCIEVGTGDEAFAVESARREFERLRELCRRVGYDWIEFIEFDGRHEFCTDDAPIGRLVNDIR